MVRLSLPCILYLSALLTAELCLWLSLVSLLFDIPNSKPSNPSFFWHQNSYPASWVFSKYSSMVGGTGVLPLPSGVVSLPLPVAASAWILFAVQSPASSSHLLLFAQSAAGDLWLTTEVLDVSIFRYSFFQWWPPSPYPALFLLLGCRFKFSGAFYLCQWLLAILLCQKLIFHAHCMVVVIWKNDLILMLS